MVSHDRYFLDQVAHKIREISRQKITSFSGNFSFYHAERELQARKDAETYSRRITEIKRLKRTAAVQAKKANRVAGKPRNLSNFDGKATAFYRAKAPRIDKRVKIIKNRIHKMNQIGKTTLLKLIPGTEPPDAGQILLGSQIQIGYSAQDLAHLNDKNSILAEVRRLARTDPDWVRTVPGCLQLEQDKVFLPIGQLSPGEKNKVSIAQILLSQANFLLLDEPTNHLDIRTRKMLEAALTGFGGTILFVSHDRRFIETVATEIWNFRDDEISEAGE